MIKKIQYYLYLLNVVIFHALNRWRFKSLGLTARIINPLRLNGTQFMSIGRNVVVQKYSWLFAGKFDDHEPELIIESGCAIGDFNHIVAIHKVHIGKNVLTANRVYISDNVHNYDDIQTPIMHQGVSFKGEVSIGDGTWIGENACVIGAKIGKNCVIGANAVVTNDIPDYCVAVGIPARVIKRFSKDTQQWEKVKV
ncbi:MAG: acyltransferase [Elusimicrobia bacterium]|nr:acyltransferase [Elusimicrobiota bacterium]